MFVAVEANPLLAKRITSKFSKDIEEGRLKIYNNCIVDNKVDDTVEFYRHKTRSGLSRFGKPLRFLSDFEVINVEPITYQEIVAEVGAPYYVKIDLEGLDYMIYNSIVKSGEIPMYISCENSTEYMKKLLTENSLFKSFNIISFYNYATIYEKDVRMSAGPFGNDIKSPWLDQKSILELYDSMPTTWFDIHFCLKELPTQPIQLKYYKKDFNPILALKQMFPHWFVKFINTVRGKKDN